MKRRMEKRDVERWDDEAVGRRGVREVGWSLSAPWMGDWVLKGRSKKQDSLCACASLGAG